MKLCRTKIIVLRIVALLLLVGPIIYKFIVGSDRTNLLWFALFGGLMVYGMLMAMTLFPTDWKRVAFEPAKVEEFSASEQTEIDRIKDKLQLKVAFGWLNVFIMAVIAIMVCVKL